MSKQNMQKVDLERAVAFRNGVISELRKEVRRLKKELRKLALDIFTKGDEE